MVDSKYIENFRFLSDSLYIKCYCLFTLNTIYTAVITNNYVNHKWFTTGTMYSSKTKKNVLSYTISERSKQDYLAHDNVYGQQYVNLHGNGDKTAASFALGIHHKLAGCNKISPLSKIPLHTVIVTDLFDVLNVSGEKIIVLTLEGEELERNTIW